MSYTKAADVLPQELIEMIQDYVDGEYLYVPRKDSNKRQWGDSTNRKEETRMRNNEIFSKYLDGKSTRQLSKDYFLSQKSIQKIIANCKSMN